MTQLGGHAHYLEPGKIYTPALAGDEVAYGTERVSDVARVLNGMGHGIALRVFGDPRTGCTAKAMRSDENSASGPTSLCSTWGMMIGFTPPRPSLT